MLRPKVSIAPSRSPSHARLRPSRKWAAARPEGPGLAGSASLRQTRRLCRESSMVHAFQLLCSAKTGACCSFAAAAAGDRATVPVTMIARSSRSGRTAEDDAGSGEGGRCRSSARAPSAARKRFAFSVMRKDGLSTGRAPADAAATGRSSDMPDRSRSCSALSSAWGRGAKAAGGGEVAASTSSDARRGADEGADTAMSLCTRGPISESHRGRLIKATRTTVAMAAICGRSSIARRGAPKEKRGRTRGRISPPSKRLSASSIAVLLASGLTGGG